MSGQDCTPFCEEDCEYAFDHHPLLVALLNSSTKIGFLKFKHQLETLESSGEWNRNDPIPDKCPEYNYPVLHWAAVLGNVRVLQWCKDQRFDLFRTCGHRSETALHRLVICGFLAFENRSQSVFQVFEDVVELLEVLLDSKDDNQDLPLHVAGKVLVEQQHDRGEYFVEAYSKLVKILAQKTYQMHWQLLNSCNVDGNTPLHILAASNRCLQLVELFLECDADFTIKNSDRQTPLDIAIINEATDVVKLLSKVSKQKHTLLTSLCEESNHHARDSRSNQSVESRAIQIDDSDDDVNTHLNNNTESEYSQDFIQFVDSENGADNFVKAKWPSDSFFGNKTSNCKPSRYVKPYHHLSNESGQNLKRKSSGFEGIEPLEKKSKEATRHSFIRPLSPTVLIAPIYQLSNSSLDQVQERIASPPIEEEELESDVDDDGSASRIIGAAGSPCGDITQNDGEIPIIASEGCWDGESHDEASVRPVISVAASDEVSRPLPVGGLNSGDERSSSVNNRNEMLLRCRKNIEDVVKNIKERKKSPCVERDNLSKDIETACRDNIEDINGVEGSTETTTPFSRVHSVISHSQKRVACVPLKIKRRAVKPRMFHSSRNINKTDCVNTGKQLLVNSGCAQNLSHVESEKDVNFEESIAVNFVSEVTTEPQPEDTVKLKRDSTESTQNTLESLQHVVSPDDFIELLRKSKNKAVEQIERLTSEYEDATHSEKIQHQEYRTLQQQIQRLEENIKQEQEKLAKWRRQADVCRKGQELATRKKVSCQEQILVEQEKLPIIEKLINTCSIE